MDRHCRPHSRWRAEIEQTSTDRTIPVSAAIQKSPVGPNVDVEVRFKAVPARPPGRRHCVRLTNADIYYVPRQCAGG